MSLESIGVPRDASFIPKGTDTRNLKCPKCGKIGEYYYQASGFMPGKEVSKYVCFASLPHRECLNPLYQIEDSPSIIWASPNGKWYIGETDYGAVYAAGVYVSDSWTGCYAHIQTDGRFLVDEDFEYRVPKYVQNAAYQILLRKFDEYSGVQSSGRRRH